MMSRVVPVLVLGVALSAPLLGCGSDDDSNGEPEATEQAPAPAPAEQPPASEEPAAPPPAAPEPPTGAGKLTGPSAGIYSQAKAVCGAFPPEKIARDLGIQADTSTSEGIVSIAEAYAEGYRGDVHQAAFEGCLDALPNPSG